MSHPGTRARVVVSKDGPYLVTGGVPLPEQIIGTDAEGGSETWERGEGYETQDSRALCRRRRWKKKPFCDGTHSKVGFGGTESSSREPYSKQAEVQRRPAELVIMDAQHLCAFARFCDTHGQVWSQIEHTDDPEVRETFLHQVGNCPASRLLAWDKASGKPIEPKLSLSIGLIETRPRSAAARSCSAGACLWYLRTASSMKCTTARRSGKPFASGDWFKGTDEEYKDEAYLYRLFGAFPCG